MRAQAVALLLLAAACQDYPFELVCPLVNGVPNCPRVDAKKITEIIKTVTPTDILFVLDTTGSMKEEIAKVQANVQVFIDEMAKSENEFQVGFITSDVECNVPHRNCGANPPTCTGVGVPPLSSYGCCSLTGPAALDPPIGCRAPDNGATNCQDQDIAPADGTYDTSTCDGGRLRASAQNTRVFARPSAANRAQWVSEVTTLLGSNTACGSPYEGAFEAALRAVACAANHDTYCPVAAAATDHEQCDNQRVRDLNRGLIRSNADLVLIFISDEDDCSTRARAVYQQPPNPTDPADQAAHLCEQFECQAHYATPGESCGAANECGNNGAGPNGLTYACNGGWCQFDSDQDGFINWTDPSDVNGPPSMGIYTCSGNPRQVNPPPLDPVASYLDAFIAIKGEVGKVRAAGVVSTTADTNAPLGFVERAACTFDTTFGVTTNCRCSSTSPSEYFCNLTEALGQLDNGINAENWHYPPPPPDLGGCQALPSARYMQFLQDLAVRRATAGEPVDTLADTICGGDYSQTMYKIVNQVILSSCFDLGANPGCAKNVFVRLNGQKLANVAPDSGERGWSWATGASKVCLEGGLTKSINDVFEIFVQEGGTCP